MNRRILWGICLVWGISSIGQPQPQAKNEFTIEIHGHILPVDSPDKGRKVPGKIHPLLLTKDQVYVVDLMSADFDAYVRIEDPQGATVAQDDDGGEGSNSRLRYTAPKDGIYSFFATSCGGGQGAYQLVVQPLNLPPKIKVAPQPMPVPKSGAPSRMAVVLTAADPADKESNQPMRIFTVKLEAKTKYQIDLTGAECDPFLRLEDSQGKKIAEDDDGGDNRNSQILFTPEKAETVRLVATTLGLPGAKADMELIVTELGKPRLADPKTIFDIKGKDGLVLDGTLKAQDPIDKTRDKCHSQVHKVNLKSGKTYVIDMKSSQVDSYLRLEDSKGNQLAEDDDGGNNSNARIQFEATMDGEFQIITTTCAPGQLGSYSLMVKEK